MRKKSEWLYYITFCSFVVFVSMSVILRSEKGRVFWIIASMVIMAQLFIGAYKAMTKNELSWRETEQTGIKNNDLPLMFFVMMFMALAVRVGFAAQYSGHYYDMGAFRGWASYLSKNGLMNFYSSQGAGVHPPGYLYVILLMGKIISRFGLSDIAANFVLKVPVMIIDIVVGAFIYKIARKKFSQNTSLIIMGVWLFNPAIFVDSAIWGQVDIVYTLFVALTLYFIAEKKLIISYCMFALAVLMKPQAVVVTPVLIYGIIDQIFMHGFNKKLFIKSLIFGLVMMAGMLAVLVPFGFITTLPKMLNNLKGSSSAVVQNAFNIWLVMGKNYRLISTELNNIGYVILALIVAFSAFVFFRTKGKEKVYITGAILILSTYMLAVKMTERYAFTSVILLLMLYIERPNKNSARLYCVASLSQFYNIAWTLLAYTKGNSIRWYSAANVLVYIYILYIVLKDYCRIDFKKLGNLTAKLKRLNTQSKEKQ